MPSEASYCEIGNFFILLTNYSDDMPHRILILDDDTDILFFCSFIFENLGFEVTSATHCKDIYDQVEKSYPDIILIDNWIPDIGGTKAIQLLKQHPVFKQIPTILFSANNNLPALAEEAGADSYLKKPFDLTTIEDMVLSMVEKKEKT